MTDDERLEMVKTARAFRLFQDMLVSREELIENGFTPEKAGEFLARIADGTLEYYIDENRRLSARARQS